MTELIDTKERIKLQATDLFMKYGVRSVSMDDIANSLGMSKKTIYQYYADKDELVDAVIMEEIRHNEKCCETDRVDSENAVHEMFLAMDMALEMFRSMNPSVLYDIQKYHHTAFAKFQRHKNDYIYGVIKANLERGIREGFYRPDINVDIIARFRAEIVLLPFNPSFQAAVKSNLADIEQEVILHYLYGLVNPGGWELIEKYKQERIKKNANNAKTR